MQICFYNTSEINTSARGLRGGPTLMEAPSVRLTQFQLCSCVSRIRWRFRGECWYGFSRRLEAYGNGLARRTLVLWITSTTTQNSELVSVGIPFMGFKELCPGVPQNSFLDTKRPRFFHLVNTRCLSLPSNILTLSQWEKTSTGVGDHQPSANRMEEKRGRCVYEWYRVWTASS